MFSILKKIYKYAGIPLFDFISPICIKSTSMLAAYKEAWSFAVTLTLTLTFHSYFFFGCIVIVINPQVAKFPKFVCIKRPHTKLLVRQSLILNGSPNVGWKSQIRPWKTPESIKKKWEREEDTNKFLVYMGWTLK